MIATTSKCLTATEMQKLIDGELDGDQFESFSDHVDGCVHCQNAIEPLSKSAVRASIERESDPYQIESECQFAIHRLLDRFNASAASKPSFAESVEVCQLGPYRILGDLGRGGMGTVCLAEHDRLKRKCAIKLLPPARVAQPGWLERFEREMAAVASLEHPGIVRASDAGTHDGWHYLVMEYLEGLDVGRVAAAIGKLPIADACEICRQAALALAHVHGSGLVHRDVKPSNLMLTHCGTVKLLDLGLVLAGDDPLSCDERLTTIGHLMGTLPAMSPEQLLDSRRVDAAADVYSLGATLYRLISGRWPYSNEGGMAARVLAITSETPPRLSSVCSGIETGLDDLVDTMMQRSKKQRPSADQVADQLCAWTDDANLKTLIRQAQRRIADGEEELPRPFTAAALSAVNVPPPRNLARRFLAGGFRALGLLAAGMLIATVTIHIRTDRGNVVVKTDGQQTQVEVVPDDVPKIVAGDENNANDSAEPVAGLNDEPERLYLGKNLSHWIDVFTRETQIESIGQAMRAVELLSRGQPTRQKAAAMTLQLANEYGTMQVDNRPDNPSSSFESALSSGIPERFMGYLAEVYPNYLPAPGLREIDHQLDVGNDKGNIAAIKILHVYVNGMYGDAQYHERQEKARKELAEMQETAEGRQQFSNLLEHLGKAFTSLQKNSSEAAGLAESQIGSTVMRDATYARITAWSTAVDMVSASKMKGEPPAWIAQHVIDRVGQAIVEYRNRPIDPETGKEILEPVPMGGGMGGGGMGGMGGIASYVTPNWVLDLNVLSAAFELRREGRLELPTSFAVDVLTHPTQTYWNSGAGISDLIDLLITIDPAAAESLIEFIDKRIEEYESAFEKDNDANALYAQISQDVSLRELGKFYAKRVEDPATALERITVLQTIIDRQTTMGGTYSPLTELIKILQERVVTE